MKRLLQVLLLLCVSVAHAQDQGETTSTTPAVVSAEETKSDFVPFSRKHLLVGLSELSFYSFYLGAPDVRGSAYLPHVSPKMGLRYESGKLGLKLAIGLPQLASEVRRRGSSRETSLIVSQYWRYLGFDAYFQSYKGLYANSPWTDFSAHRPLRFPQLPDAFALNSGINVYYVYSPNRYSLSAAFSQNEFQSVSGGSWLSTAFYNHLRLSTGNVFIPGTDPNSPQHPPNISAGSFDTLGAGGGYGYSWIVGRRFIVAQGVAGLGAQYQQADRTLEGRYNAFSPAVMLNVNGAAGFNYENYLWGVKGLVHSLSSRVRDIQVASNLVTVQIFAGGRF